MINIFSQRKHCFCAFCKNPRSVYKQKHIDFVSLFLILTVGLTFGFYVSQGPGTLEIAFILLMAIAGEVIFHFRWRVSLICKYCGFDPIVYLRNPESAAARVKQKLETRKDDPEAILGPPVILPRQTMSSEKGVLISRQV